MQRHLEGENFADNLCNMWLKQLENGNEMTDLCEQEIKARVSLYQRRPYFKGEVLTMQYYCGNTEADNKANSVQVFNIYDLILLLVFHIFIVPRKTESKLWKKSLFSLLYFIHT